MDYIFLNKLKEMEITMYMYTVITIFGKYYYNSVAVPVQRYFLRIIRIEIIPHHSPHLTLNMRAVPIVKNFLKIVAKFSGDMMSQKGTYMHMYLF